MTLHLTDIETSAKRSTPIGVLDLAHSTQVRPYRQWAKRVVETALVIVTLPLTLPVILILALLVALDGSNPFYSQLRVGKGGRNFRMWKLRTMVPAADDLLKAYLTDNPEARIEWDVTQKLKRDPRITRIGRLLRKTSLDELPQLWNVLNGTMALVGPRPMMVEQKKYYFGRAYYDLRPGITGLWQISDRNEGEFARRVKFDDLYDKTLSLKTDLTVLFRTVSVVVRGTGY